LAYDLLRLLLTSRHPDREPFQQHDPIARSSGYNASGNILGLSPERTPGRVPTAAPGKSQAQGVPGSDAKNVSHQKRLQQMTGGGGPVAKSTGSKIASSRFMRLGTLLR
jgi:hypothetical protein